MADPGRPQHEAVGGVGRRSAAAVLTAEKNLTQPEALLLA